MRLVVDQADFRRYAARPSGRRDFPYYAICQELVGTRWESFTSFVSEKTYRKNQEVSG